MNYESGAVSGGQCISEGWELIRPNYWPYVGMTLVLGVIAFAASMVVGLINYIVVFVVTLAVGQKPGAPPALDQATAIIQGASFLSGSVLRVFTSMVVGILVVGVFKSLARTSRGDAFDFSDLFSGFGQWKACAVVAVIVAVMTFVFSLVIFAVLGAGFAATVGFDRVANGEVAKHPEILLGAWPVLVVLIPVYIVVGLVWGSLQTMTYPLISRGVSGAEAFVTSIKAGFANLGGLVVLVILLGLIMFVGMVPCFLGLPFVTPIVYGAVFRAFERVFGRAADDRDVAPPSPQNYGFQSY